MAIVVTVFLLLAITFSFVALPDANAADPPRQFASFAYIVPAPNPVGVGQKVSIVMWIDRPLPSSNVNNDIRRFNYKLTITKPDGTKEVMNWPVVEDTTSIQYVSYTPDQVGEYTLLFEYPGQTYTWSGQFQNDVFGPASKTVTFTVQQDPLPEATTSYPLPTEYWSRPIEGQNTDWWSISSNWLGNPFIEGAGTSYGIPGGIQPEGSAPNTPHIMWSRPLQDGGVVGGSSYHTPGTTYYTGSSYNTRYSNALIMHGRLYYELPWGNSGGGGGWICVDLRTGEEIWRNEEMGKSIPGPDPPEPYFGYLYDYDMYNQHGVVGSGWLFSTNFGTAFDPLTGRTVDLNITNVPSGTSVGGPHGEVLRYVWSRTDQWLAQWNSSQVFTTQTSGTRDASTPNRYDWNVSIPLFPSGSSIRYAKPDDVLLVSDIRTAAGSGFTSWGTNDPYMVAAISLKPGSRGQLLFTKSYAAPGGGATRNLVAWDPDNRVFVMMDEELLVHYGYSLDTGEKLWGPTEPTNDYTYFRQTTLVAYGKIYFAGYGGVLYCYDVKTGERLWTYGNGGPGNSTNSGLETAWGTYPIFVDVIADGKVYLATTEHSAGSPYYKDTRYRCVNATTGEEIWTLMGWGTGMDAGCDIIADGYLAFLNSYDMRIYCVGKGPSALTVEAPMTGVTLGSSLVIRGTVMDIAAGTKQHEQVARFPNGVPAVADESMGPWMEYVYMQKPRPTDVIGVPVSIDVIDANGNYRNIGTVTSDSNGFFTYHWTPDIPGMYTVIATFAGSNSFWPSHAETSFCVDEAPAAPAPTPEPLTMPPFDMYILYATVAIIATIVIIGVLILRKK